MIQILTELGDAYGLMTQFVGGKRNLTCTAFVNDSAKSGRPEIATSETNDSKV